MHVAGAARDVSVTIGSEQADVVEVPVGNEDGAKYVTVVSPMVVGLVFVFDENFAAIAKRGICRVEPPIGCLRFSQSGFSQSVSRAEQQRISNCGEVLLVCGVAHELRKVANDCVAWPAMPATFAADDAWHGPRRAHYVAVPFVDLLCIVINEKHSALAAHGRARAVLNQVRHAGPLAEVLVPTVIDQLGCRRKDFCAT